MLAFVLAAMMQAVNPGGGGGAVGPSGENVVAYSATPTFSILYQTNAMTLTGNVTTFTLPAGQSGQQECLLFVQDTTARTVTAPANVLGFFTIGTTASKRNFQCFSYSTAQSAWLAQGAGTINF